MNSVVPVRRNGWSIRSQRSASTAKQSVSANRTSWLGLTLWRSKVPVGDSMMSEHSIPLQQDGDCCRPVTDGQPALHVFTGFEDDGWFSPMMIFLGVDDIDSKFPIGPQGDVLLFNFPHERPSEIL